MHAKYGIAFLQMEIAMAVLGDLGRYRTESTLSAKKRT